MENKTDETKLKYSSIFKSKLFWLMIVIFTVIQAAEYNKQYEEVFFSEYLGIFIGSFIFIFLIANFIFGLQYIYKKFIFKRNI